MKQTLITLTLVSTLASMLVVGLMASPVFADTLPENDWQAMVADFSLPDGAAMEEMPGVVQAISATGKAGPIYLFNRGAHALVKFSAKGKYEREIGAGLFSSPHGLRLGPDGTVWTTDVGNHLVLGFAPDGRVRHVYGKKGTASPGWFDRDYNQTFFDKPSDVAFDADGNMYVADGGNFRVVKFSPDGHVLAVWGEKGTGPGQFNFPHAVVVMAGQLYVADRENQRIQIFDLDGSYVTEWSGIGYPYVLEADGKGGLWMTDARTDQIVHLDADGKVLSRTGGPGKAVGQYGFLHGVARRAAGGLWLSDILNWRVTVLARPTGK